MTIKIANVGALLCSSFERYQSLPALWLGRKTISYAALFSDAAKLAKVFIDKTEEGARIGLLAQRSYSAYVAVLASMLSGRPYVPINMKFPLERQLSIASIARCRLLISDEYSQQRCVTLLNTLGCNVFEQKAIPDEEDNTIFSNFQLEKFSEAKSDTAYIMFTSGTTGIPKGVAVSRENLASYLAAISEIVPIPPETRCTQLFDLSFDLSVHDVFQTWVSGGCLYIPGNEDMLDPVGFAQRHALQAWFSVPSVVAMARRFGRLGADALPSLRLSLFCGEPLPVSLAEDWARTAPNSKIWNLYGPTEATIAVMAKEFEPSLSATHQHATVPLGEAFCNSAAVIIGQDGSPAKFGELWLGGAQISAGYINNDDENREKFVGRKIRGYPYSRWYRTGDLVELDDRFCFIFQGRMDDQAKIQGYRIELLEVEEALRRASGASEVAAVLWPVSDTGAASGIVGFVCSAKASESEVIAGCRDKLPSYAVPKKIIFVDTLPFNSNGKVDRKRLKALYLQGSNPAG